MGTLSLKDKVCGLIYLVLVLASSNAEREYFPNLSPLTWEAARENCQVCFKDLVTVTAENTQTLSQLLTSDCWIGLRKNFSFTSNSVSNSSMYWSFWANGEPLVFQNWYPGWPVLKSSFLNRYSCKCPATAASATAAPTTLPPTTAAPTTLPPTTAAIVVPETDENYIEDSCVAMLSFGAWVEKNCLALLPSICYEERFFGQVIVTNKTSESANLTWQPGPDNITHYRVEVKFGTELTLNTNSLTHDLVNLTAGTLYSVQVFPVKCMRDLNPQEVTFYTTPNKVERLTAANVTETSIFLDWEKPAGNSGFYRIEMQDGKQIQSTSEGLEVAALTPGNLYTFTVLTGVGDNRTWSEESTVAQYTRPVAVSDLRVTEYTFSSLLLAWVLPEGKASSFRVMAVMDSNSVLFDKEVNQTEVNVTGLPMGTKITLTVTALANDSLEGANVTVVNYTAPGPISNLTVVATYDSLDVTWSSGDNSVSFNVELQLDGKNVQTHNQTETAKYFDNLKTAANYTVIVFPFIAHVKGSSVARYRFTKPSPPTDVRVVYSNKNQITVQWSAPQNIATASYAVSINSSFWSYTLLSHVHNITSYTVRHLHSGTKYDFRVQTMADQELSAPATHSHFTESEKREIGLSMMCSSAKPLFCDSKVTREYVLNQLRAHLYKVLGDNIVWKLEKQETENQGA
ncbi:receptor-type tyrosine-protein phosphatase eta isoform X2 [Cottoperca gobio]|uniref:Receptor-type tyrosine-protein phosphatase eta isoform X2 n=1 Tax=Cottoperca gobio TaxID=56716 RepID=A0A6J2RLS1_COTGO|nr:receptor-type tyrosine-protein phosphatase eta-like isoform X2 [Cottoperca gobio]